MLTLLLLRHAKAVSPSGDDFARDLTAKGHEDAGRLGAFLAEKRLVPDLALVSPAARTRQTVDDVMAQAGRAFPVLHESMLYNATHHQLIGRLRDLDKGTRSVMIVGHNPGIMDCALTLSSTGDLHDFDAMRARFPPCSLAVIEFDRDDWDEAAFGGGRLDWYVTPDLLGQRR